MGAHSAGRRVYAWGRWRRLNRTLDALAVVALIGGAALAGWTSAPPFVANPGLSDRPPLAEPKRPTDPPVPPVPRHLLADLTPTEKAARSSNSARTSAKSGGRATAAATAGRAAGRSPSSNGSCS